ncbi:MAG: arginase family protein [Candidatus Aenigmarchaeota archaeon]|nr:arginase family protein [Candidatus Aenigmarchaeota archaeon]
MTELLFTSKSFVPEYPLEEADVCFLGIPFDSTATAIGNQRFGPPTVRYALKNAISYVPERNKNPLKELKVCDVGDVDVAFGDYEETSFRIRDTIDSIFKINPKIFLVVIGGEHLITLPIVEALKPKTIVHLDAHRDLVSSDEEKFAHNTWAYFASNEGFRIVQIGVRSWEEVEEENRKKFKIMNNSKGLKGPIYLSIDMDVFDPAYAPDTGFKEPNGLSPREVFEIIDKVFEKKVIGMDVVEISSDRFNNPTSELAARTILRALSNLKR